MSRQERKRVKGGRTPGVGTLAPPVQSKLPALDTAWRIPSESVANFRLECLAYFATELVAALGWNLQRVGVILGLS